MQTQLRLRWLLREARKPGVILSNQIGMTVYALRKLDLLSVSTSSSGTTGMLPVIKAVCIDADARSQVNVLHALAHATSEQCSPRVTLHAELYDTLQTVQAALMEQMSPLTAPETIMTMEALAKLAPFSGEGGSVIFKPLLDEVQERTVALATVVERSADLLGVTRVTVEAATSAAATTASSSLTLQSLTSVSTASWAAATLEQMLLVVHARLTHFAKQDLIALVDALTVRPAASAPAPDVGDASPSSPAELAPSAAAPANVDADVSGGVFLDAARFLLGDLLNAALVTVPALSISQLAAWLSRLVHLQLTEHALLHAVLTALLGAARLEKEFTVAQLSSVCTSLTALVPIVVAAPGKLPEKELCLRAYAQMLNLLVTPLHSSDRGDASAAALARERVLPLLCSVPEAALDDYLAQASAADGRTSLPHAAITPDNSSMQVRISVVLSTTLEKGTALLLRCFDTLTPREQAYVAGLAFHWHLYMPSAATLAAYDEPQTRDGATLLPSTLKHAAAGASGATTRLPMAIEMVSQCSFMEPREAARKHRAVCGLVESRFATWGAKDVVQVLNEVVVAHHRDRGAALRRPVSHAELPPATLAAEAPKKDPLPLTASELQTLQEVAAKERSELCAHLLEQLLGPLKESLPDIHTAQLVRCLSSMSKMNVRTRASYNAVLQLLKGRSLTSFEQISVLGVLARHHLRSPYVVYGVIRDLKLLGQTLHTSQKVLVLRYLGQVGAQRLLKAPCAEGLLPGAFFSNTEELTHLSVLELVFSFSGLVELRQNANPTTQHVLAELVGRVTPTGSGNLYMSSENVFHAVRSPTAVVEFLAALCRYGGPAQGVTAALLLDVMVTAQRRLESTRSLFVDVTQLTWYWPCISLYFDPSSALWVGCTPAGPLVTGEEEVRSGGSGGGDGSGDARGAFSSEEWVALRDGFAEVRAVAQQQLRRRLQSIADSPQLRPNTFLWNQMACGIRFDALPPRGSEAVRRLWDHLDRKALAPLLANPQQLLDVMTVALYRLPEDEADAAEMLQFVRKHIASMRLQDALQVWWCASQFLTSPQQSATVSEKARRLLESVRTAAKQATTHEEKAVREKLSVMEHRIFDSLL